MEKHVPRKRFGQHFLKDQQVIQHIIQAIEPNDQDHWVEIGPGLGALTLPILPLLKSLDVIELDRDAAAILIKRVESIPHQSFKLYQQDVLTVDFASLRHDERPLRIFGNLPYNISTPLLFHLMSHATQIEDMVFMLQKEVADRIGAEVNTSAYGRLSVMMQYHAEITHLFDVAPTAFDPPPKVQSSVIRIMPIKQRDCVALDVEFFSTLVMQAFQQRRKTLRNSLSRMIEAHEWLSLPIDPSVRAETISVDAFVELANALLRLRGKGDVDLRHR